MTVFLQIVILAGGCYLGVFTWTQVKRALRRRERRRAWRELDSRTPTISRPASRTPGRAA